MSLVRLKQIESGTSLTKVITYAEDNLYDKIFYDSDSQKIKITVPFVFSPGNTETETETGSTDTGTGTAPANTDTGVGPGSTVTGGGSGSGSDSTGGGNSGDTDTGGSGGPGDDNDYDFATKGYVTTAVNNVIGEIPSTYATLGHLYKLIIKLHDPYQTEGNVTLPGYNDNDTGTLTLPTYGNSGAGGSGGGPGTPGGEDEISPTGTAVSKTGFWYGQLYIDSANTGTQRIGTFFYNQKKVDFFANLAGYALVESPEFTGSPKIKNSDIAIPKEAPPAADVDKIPTVGFVYNYFTNMLGMLPEAASALASIKELLTSTKTPVTVLEEILATKLDKSDVSVTSFNTDGQQIGSITVKDTTTYLKVDLSGYAPLASPTFTGTPTATTPDGDDNSTRIATTAFVNSVVAEFFNTLPTVIQQFRELIETSLNDETTVQGLMTMIESKVPLDGNSRITGDIVIDGTLSVTGGISGTLEDVSVGEAEKAEKDANGNVIHTTYAPIDSPTFTGTPATTNIDDLTDSSTRIATTAFVQALISALKNVDDGGLPDTYKNFDSVWIALNNDPGFGTKIYGELDGKQPLNAALTSISNLVTAANTMIYTTAPDSYNTTTLTAYARALLEQSTQEGARQVLQAVSRRRPGGEHGYTGTDATTENMRYVRAYPKTKASYKRGEGFTFNDARETNTNYTDWSLKSYNSKAGTAGNALKWILGQENEDYKALDADHADVADICRYNAGTATVLRDIQNIDGIDFDGSANICRFAVDTLSASATERTVTINSKKIAADTTISPSSTTVSNLFKLVSGARITVMFKNGCSQAEPKLKVNDTTAAYIKYRGNRLVAGALPKGCVYDFVYYDSAWHVVGTMSWTNTQNTTGLKSRASMATQSDTDGGKIEYYTKPEADNTFVTFGTSEYVKSVTVDKDKVKYTRGDNSSETQQIFMVAYSNKQPGHSTDCIWFDKSHEVITYYTGGTDKRFGAVYK